MRTSRIILLASGSRFVIFCIQVLANYFIEDHRADAYYNGLQPSKGLMSLLFSGLTRWDGQHFLAVANRGYVEERNLAFFPIYPLMMSILGSCLEWLSSNSGGYLTLTRYDSTIVAGLLVSFISFNIAALALHSLTSKLFDRDQKLSNVAVYAFCLNPASIFFSSIYSESLFAALSFSAMKFLAGCDQPADQNVAASLLIGISCATRSNGLVSLGFLIYRQLIRLKELFGAQTTLLRLQWELFVDVIRSSFHAVLVFWPFLTFQLYTFNRFCNPVPHNQQAQENEPPRPPRQVPEWCHGHFPFAYTYVQRKYWGVSFLGYFQLKQWPNFLLASPILLMISFIAVRYLTTNWSARRHLRRRQLIKSSKKSGETGKSALSFWNNLNLLPYVIHAAFLAGYCLLNAHVQIVTRLLCSASPLPYWFVAYCVTRPRASPLEKKLGRYYLSGYFATYLLVGAILHANFYPWT